MKKNKKDMPVIHIGALVQNLVIVNVNKEETSEELQAKVTEALLKATQSATLYHPNQSEETL